MTMPQRVELSVSIAPAQRLVIVTIAAAGGVVCEAQLNLAEADQFVGTLQLAIGKLGSAHAEGRA